jgi:NAD(P)-dependent dehydrogenase (short-subunit alcohol dehydrogenase family)
MGSVMITGASGGVAQAAAHMLRERGERVILVGRDASKLQAQPGDIAIEADVSTLAGAEHAFQQAQAALQAVPDALLHCVGSTVIAPIARTSEAQYRACMAANIDSAFFCTKLFLAQLSEAKKPGNIVLFSSVVAGIGVSNHAAIAAAKGAIEALTRSLATDFASAGVRVNCIAPGLMRSPMTARMLGSEAAEKQIAAQYPLGRFGDASDGAAAACWLLSEQSGWITGQVIHLDGGFSAIRPYVRAST